MLSNESEAQTPLLAEVGRLQSRAIINDKGGRAEVAEALYSQVLTLHEQALGPDHPDLMESLGCLAYFYGRHNRYADAQPLILRGLAILEAKPGPKHRGILQTLDALASQARDCGSLDSAERYHRQVIAARQRHLGPDHPRTVKSLAALDEVLEAKRDPQAEAERVATAEDSAAATRAVFERAIFEVKRGGTNLE